MESCTAKDRSLDARATSPLTSCCAPCVHSNAYSRYAILAFFGELIPMVGLTLATIPALFLAWVHGGTSLLGVVAIIYFIISQLENHVLYPKVMNKMVGVPSVVVIIAIVIGAKLAGIWGVVLAVPLASVLMELADDINKRKSNVG